MHLLQTLPPIAVSCPDHNDLVFALAFARDEESASFLREELQRAALCRTDDLPDDVVALNCRVVFRLADEPVVLARLLVHPVNLLCPITEVSALSPVGAALLGLRVGDVMPFFDGGKRREVSVTAVGMRFVGNGTPRFRGQSRNASAIATALAAREACGPNVGSEYHV